MNSLIVPDSGIRLNDGDLVMLQRFPGTKWTVNYGWYTYNSCQAMGWYFCAIPTKTILPAAGRDLATVALIKRANRPDCSPIEPDRPCRPEPPCPPPPPIMPPPPPPEYPPHPSYPDYPYPDHDHPHHPNPPHRPPCPPPPPPPPPGCDCDHGTVEIPPELQQDVDRSFITVDTIAQRDMLSSSKMLPHGKLVKVNSTPYGTKYYSWNLITQSWDLVDLVPDLSNYLTRDEAKETFLTEDKASELFLTEKRAEDKFLTETSAEKIFVTTEKAEETYVTKTEAVDSQPKWEPIG